MTIATVAFVTLESHESKEQSLVVQVLVVVVVVPLLLILANNKNACKTQNQTRNNTQNLGRHRRKERATGT